MHRDLTSREQQLLATGLGRWQDDYVVPVIRGGTEDPPPAGDPPAAAPAAPPAPSAPAASDRVFSQADVDRIVQDRLARAKQATPDDYEDLKAKAARLAEIEAANQTELERAQARAAELEQREQRATQTLIEAAVLAEATRQQAVKPEHLHRLITIDEVTVGDDGQVTGAQEAVKAFLDANPEYVGSRALGSADQGARGNSQKQLRREDLQGMSPSEIRKAHEEGRLDSLTGA